MNASSLKDLLISPAIENDEQLRKSVLWANDLLVEEIGASSGLVEAEWRIVPSGKEKPVIELKISDFTGSADIRLTAIDFADEWRLRRRLYNLWGDLLQDRSRRRLQKLHEVVKELPDE